MIGDDRPTPDHVSEVALPDVVEYVVALPDSILAPLVRAAIENSRVQYIQVAHESQAIGIAAGLSLSGRRPLVVMENSGLRAAAESIARLLVLHGINLLMLVSNRGGLGDPNWWAQYHSQHAEEISRTFGLRYFQLGAMANFTDSVEAAFAQTQTRSSSVVLAIDPGMLTGVSGA